LNDSINVFLDECRKSLDVADESPRRNEDYNYGTLERPNKFVCILDIKIIYLDEIERLLI